MPSLIGRGLKWIGKNILPGLIGTGASTAGQIAANRDSQRRALEMWQTQQEYNLPENQMKRLQDAGINPHLAFGKGSISNVATQAPQAPELRVNTGLEELAKYQQISNLRAQNDLIRAQAQKAYAEAAVAEGTAPSDIRIRQLQEMMSEIEHTQKRFGVEKAEPMLKVLFQTLDDKTGSRFNFRTGETSPPELTEDQVRKIMSGIVITQGVAKILTALGFGRLLGKSKNTKPYTNYNKRTTIHNYN